ncbi:MAG TPA: hypothetical protein VGK03_11930 [Geothrix sp.]
MEAPSQSFPQDLAAVPEGERIPEAFGWAPSSWALGSAILATMVLFQPAKLERSEILLAAAALLLALFLVVHEIRRRKRPKVLVRPGYGPLIGLYREGRFQRTVELAQSHVLIRHPTRTWGPILMLSLATLASLAFLLPGSIQISWSDRCLAVLAAGFSASLAASVVKTRLRCEECLFPYPSSPDFEHVLVPKQDIKRIFGGPG